MKRPRSVAASIVVMLIGIVCVLMITIMLPVLRNIPIRGLNISSRSLIMNFIIPAIAAGVDVVFLFMRRRWVYYFNLVLVGLYILLFIPLTSFILFLVIYDEKSQVGWILKAIFAAAPLLLLIWLFLDLLLRKEVKKYLSRTEESSIEAVS